ILETDDNNELYDDLSDILNIYYGQDYNQIELYNRNLNNSFLEDFESRLNLEGSIISDDYYLEDVESRLNLEGSIISDNYYLEDSTIPDNYYSKNLKTYKAQSKIIEVDNNLIESNNNIIDSHSNIVNSQEIITISDLESQSYTTQEKQK
ncbi:27968_t:CDS:1, partial [Dentiscutata erythropus]